jgi:group I intron endonuclease
MAPSIVNVECVSGIYRIQNKINGKFYIGSSVNIRWRVHKHLSHLRRGLHNNTYLQSAFTKHGEQAFTVEMVAQCEPADLLATEQRYLDALAPQYNICQFAANTLGYRHTAQSKAKMSVANKGNQHGLGSKHSDATKARLSEMASKRRATAETKAKISRAGLGNKSNTGRTLPPDHVAKVAAASLRMWNGADAHERRTAASERAKARWADPVWKAEQSRKMIAARAKNRAHREQATKLAN